MGSNQVEIKRKWAKVDPKVCSLDFYGFFGMAVEDHQYSKLLYVDFCEKFLLAHNLGKWSERAHQLSLYLFLKICSSIRFFWFSCIMSTQKYCMWVFNENFCYPYLKKEGPKMGSECLYLLFIRMRLLDFSYFL